MKRPGFTLIELLAAFAVVAVLAAMLIPAVQRARESARRAQCASNLKQLGRAIQTYMAIHSVVPPSGGYYTADNRVWQRHSMKARILSFMEQGATMNAINFEVSPVKPSRGEGFALGRIVNGTAGAVQIGSFLCPSDPNPGNTGRNRAGDGALSFGVGVSNYPNNLGTNRAYTGGRINGPAYYLGGDAHARATADVPADVGLATTVAGITDGLSRTALVGEWVKGSDGARAAGLNLLYFNVVVGTMNSDEGDYQACQAANTVNPWDYKGEYWMVGDVGRGGGYHHISPPNSKSCKAGPTFHDGWNTGWNLAAGSFHPGGVNVAFCDGSVRFVTNAVGRDVWRAIGTSAGGERIAVDQY